MSKSYELWGGSSPPPYTEEDQHEANGYASKETLETAQTDISDGEELDRGQWGSKAEFILSCVGLSVGLGNVWRFPVLAYENGGAAFLIPYIILQVLIGKPMYFMELSMGQFSNLGPTGVWRMNPMAKGIGVSMALISLIVAIYYNVIMAYTLYYFFATMQTDLPWIACKDAWMNKSCVARGPGLSGPAQGLLPCNKRNATQFYRECVCVERPDSLYMIDEFMMNYEVEDNCTFFNTTKYRLIKYDATEHNDTDRINGTMFNESYVEVDTDCVSRCIPLNETRPAADIYFYDDVIQRAERVDDVGEPIWYLVLCLILSWIIVVLCLIKGVKSSGKVVYFTATFPYVILLVLLIRGATLNGAATGVVYFLVPEWEKLLNLEVWQRAASQMFFSLSVSFGGIIMFGSYNKFNNNVYTHALFISVMDIVTSIIAGFVIFTTLGNMSYELGIDIEDVAKKGYGLAFVAYPEALSRLPVPHLWSLLFFFMLFTLGLDSEFALLETVLTCIQDEVPKLRKKKWLLCIVCGVACFFLALPCTTRGGDYVVNIMDTYGASFSVLFVAAAELIAVMWVYRADRFMKDVTYMLGYSPHPKVYWLFCWALAAPILVLLLLVYTFVQYKPPNYEIDQYRDEKEQYPVFAQVIGWILAAFVMLPIPIWAIVTLVRKGGNIFEAVKPTHWGPSCGSGSTEALDAHPMYNKGGRVNNGIDNIGLEKY